MKIIGQTELLERVKTLISSDKFPRFSIIAGPEGSGKKMLANYISKELSTQKVDVSIKVDGIREMITLAHKAIAPTMFVIADADNMSPAAKNAMLKVVEEPPNDAYFIMTLRDINQTLATIKSRAQVFNMQPYTPSEIGQYAIGVTSEEMHIISDICETPGEVDKLKTCGIISFDEYVKMVVDNIAEVSGSNSFKIADKIKMKDDKEGYDLRLFWKAFMTECSNRLSEDVVKYALGIKITSKYLQELNITGISKPSTFDMWLLDIRGEWMSYGDN